MFAWLFTFRDPNLWHRFQTSVLLLTHYHEIGHLNLKINLVKILFKLFKERPFSQRVEGDFLRILAMLLNPTSL